MEVSQCVMQSWVDNFLYEGADIEVMRLVAALD